MFAWLYNIVLRALKDFFLIRKSRKKKFIFRWYFGVNSFVEGYMARVTTEEQVSVVVKPVTRGGNPAKIDGDVVFTSSDDTVATVTSTGQFGAVVKAVGVGATQIVAKFDADLGGEIREIVLSGAVEVVEPEADNGVLEFGAPELQPAPAPAPEPTPEPTPESTPPTE